MPIASFAGATWRRRWRLAGAAAFISILAYLALGIVIVQPDEVAVAQRFGRYEGALSPGLHLRLPPPWDTIVKDQPARVRTIEIGLRTATPDPGSAGPAAIEWNSPHQEGAFERRADEAIILTGDQSLVEVGATVQFHVRDLRAFRFTVREPERVLASLAEGVIREILATEPLLASSDAQPNAREILTTARGDLEERIRVELQARANSLQLGVEVLPHGVCLQDVHPPLEVVGAFRDVSMAFKEKERMRNEADALYRDKVIKAGGEAAWRQLAGGDAALSDAVWEQLQGQIAGEAAAELFSAQAFASQQQELAAGHAASFVLQEAAHARSPQLTAWRLFLDTLAAAMSGKKKLILDHEGAGRRHLFLGVPQSGANAMQPLMGLPGPLDPEADE